MITRRPGSWRHDPFRTTRQKVAACSVPSGSQLIGLAIRAGVGYNGHWQTTAKHSETRATHGMHWNDLIGHQLGPYEIIEELGRGGSARVYRAYQEALRRYVAIKILINDSEDRLGFVRRFEREAAVVAQLSHPNIVAVYDSGEHEELVYLVMQCVTGGTLRQRLGQPLPV